MRLSLNLLLISIFLLSCSGVKYDEYRAAVMPDPLTLSPGEESYLAVKIEIKNKTYIYANPKGPGTGLTTELTAETDAPVDISSAKYPEGKKYTAEGEKLHVNIYKNEVYLFLPLRARRDASEGRYNINLKVKSLVCDYSACIPMLDNLTAELVISKSQNSYIHEKNIDSQYKLASEPPRLSELSSDGSEPAEDEDRSLLSKIVFEARDFDPPVRGIMQAVLFGILAGFILNFMPCVLPVVSLKIMSFVKSAGSSRRELFIMGCLFSAGIMSSFTLLAVLMAFFGYNWGGLFQYSGFLIAMTSIVFALAMSMFGVFTLNIPGFAAKAAALQPGSPYADAFSKGLLATLLATPCSGPFLGGTLAWTLTQPPAVIFTVFISIGAGMALPYMLLSSRPSLLRFIPRPGPWMKTFEASMAFLLILTVIYLINVLDPGLRMPFLLFLAFLTIGLYQYGRLGSAANSRLKRGISSAVLIAVVSGSYWFSFEYIYGEKQSAALPVKAYTEEALISNRDSGVTTMVKFTADWCPNCRLVEARALNRGPVIEKIQSEGIDFLTADITRTNIQAEKILEKLDLYSIPVLIVFPPGEGFSRPLVLRDLYSKDDVLKAIEMISP